MTPAPNEKGAEYERDVCSKLSLWVSRFQRKDCYWRSAMSGGRATQAAKKSRGHEFNAQAGDLTATHGMGLLLTNLFCIDTKFYKDFFLQLSIFGRKGLFEEAWKATVREAEEAKKMPLMIFKQNRQPDLIAVDQRGELTLRRGVENGETEFPCMCIFPQYGAYIHHLKDMLADVDFDLIREDNNDPYSNYS